MNSEIMDELERTRAMFLVTMAINLAGDYSQEEDLDAATIALLTRALEVAKEQV
jgi:hypothetical protein